MHKRFAKGKMFNVPLYSRSAIEAHRSMTASSFKRPMPPLFPLAHEARGNPKK